VNPVSSGRLTPSKPVSQGAISTGPKPTTQVPPKPVAEKPTVEVSKAEPGAKTDKPVEKPKADDKSGPQKKSNTYDETDRPSWV